MEHAKAARAQLRERRLSLFADVRDMLQRSHRVVSIVADPIEPRRLIGQLLNGTFLAIHVRVPGDVVSDQALEYMRRAVVHKAAAFFVGDVGEVDRWFKQLAL